MSTCVKFQEYIKQYSFDNTIVIHPYYEWIPINTAINILLWYSNKPEYRCLVMAAISQYGLVCMRLPESLLNNLYIAKLAVSVSGLF